MVLALLPARGGLRPARPRPARLAAERSALAVTGIQTTLLGQHLRIVSPLFLWLSPLALLVGAWAAIAAFKRQQRVRKLLGARLSQVFPGAGAGQGIARG